MDQNAHIIPIDEFQATCLEFWHIYYESMRELHARRRWVLTEPLRDRNLGTTASRHVAVFENFWRQQLATAIGVERHEVGSRTIQFREHRSKSFDVCWPLTGEPKILISCPARFKKSTTHPEASDWQMSLSEVSELLSYQSLIPRLVETARLRGFL